MSEDSNCYKFGLIGTLRAYEKNIRHSKISKNALEEDLINRGKKVVWKKYLEIVERNLTVVKFTLNKLPKRMVHSQLASHLVPLATMKSFNGEKMNYELVLEEEKILTLFREIKNIAEEKEITISMHSTQFVSLASDDEIIRKNSQDELIYYAKILELISSKSVIIIHLNSKQELVKNLGKEGYFNRTAESVRELPPYILSMICLKNEVRGFWNSSNLYDFHLYCSKKYGMSFPLVWDNAHEAANPSQIGGDKENWEWFADTWINRTPFFYWSESCGDNKIAHCDYYHQKDLPPSSVPVWICEIKKRELALQELLKENITKYETNSGFR